MFKKFKFFFVFGLLLPNAAAANTIDAASWLQTWYAEFPIGGDWQVTSAIAEERIARVLLIVPQDQADSLMSHPSERQFRAISVACPSKLEAVWSLLSAGEDIEITAAGSTTPKTPFIDVSCRDWGF